MKNPGQKMVKPGSGLLKCFPAKPRFLATRNQCFFFVVSELLRFKFGTILFFSVCYFNVGVTLAQK